MAFYCILAFIHIWLTIENWQNLMKWYIFDWLAVLEAGFVRSKNILYIKYLYLACHQNWADSSKLLFF